MIGCLTVISVIGVLSAFFAYLMPKTKNNKIIYLVLCAVTIILQMGLRDGTIQLSETGDVVVYFTNCKNALDYSFVEYLATLKKDYGYYILNWLIAHIFREPQVILFVVPTIICFFSFRFIYKYSDNVYLSVILFFTLGFYGFALTAFRQSIAMAICLWAYDYVKKKKIIPFILITLLAASFHQTAIIFLPVYVIGRIKLTEKNVIIYTALLAVAFLFGNIFFDFFNKVFNMDYGKEEVESLTGRIKDFTIFFIVFGLLYLSLKGKNPEERLLLKSKTDSLTFILMTGVMFYALQFKVLIAFRIAKYFIDAINYVLIANVTESFKDKTMSKVFKACFIIFSVLLFFISISRNNLYEYVYII